VTLQLCIGITPVTVNAFRIDRHLCDSQLRTRSNPREQSICMRTASGTTAMPSSINERQNQVILDPFLRYDEYLNHSKTIESFSYFVFALNQHKYMTTESRTSLSAMIAMQLQPRIGAFIHPPQLGIKISKQFIIAHLRLTFLGHPLPCLPHPNSGSLLYTPR
jgi:hypothetical protein